MIRSEDWGTWRVRLYGCCPLFAQEHASGEILIFWADIFTIEGDCA